MAIALWIVTVMSLAYGLALVVSAPRILSRATWAIDHPEFAIYLWKSSVLAGAFAVVTGLVTIAVLIGAPPPPPHPHAITLADLLYLALGLAVIGTLIAIFVRTRRVREERGIAAALRRAPKRPGPGGVLLDIVPSERPLAFAVPGRRPEVAVSEALVELLTPEELRAVIAHERAHVELGHARTIAVCQMIADLTRGWLPAASAMESSMRLLIELEADDEAALECGPGAVAAALSKLNAARPAQVLALRAERIAGYFDRVRVTTQFWLLAIVLPLVPIALAMAAALAYTLLPGLTLGQG